MKPHQLTYEFDDLQPLPGLELYAVGSAEIEYGMDGDWSVASISLTTAGRAERLDEPSRVAPPIGLRDHLYIAIKAALDSAEATSIQRMVDAEIADAAADRATYRGAA